MIYSAVLLDATTRRKIAAAEFYSKRVSRATLNKYLTQFDEQAESSRTLKYKPITLEAFKFFGRACGDGFLIFITDLDESDDEITRRIKRAARSMRYHLDKKDHGYVKKNFNEVISRYIVAPLVIALVGESGVGKTSLLHLLLGKEPPTKHVPTIALNTESVENIRFANYELLILDFAGEDQYERIRDFTVIDMFFLLTDSTLKNIITSKRLYDQIQRDCPDLPIVVIANKQDLTTALDPTAISKVMGVDVQPLVAIDLAYRDDVLCILAEALSTQYDLKIDDKPPVELLSLTE